MTSLPATPATFNAVFAKAQGGDTLLLAPGTYSGLGFNGLNFSTPVTITSADPAHPAVLAPFNIGIGSPVSGLTFRSLDLAVPLPNYNAFNTYSSQHITFDQVHVYGPAGAPDPNVQVMNFFDSAFVTVTNCEIERVAHGLTVSRSDNIVVSGNHIHHVNSDTLDFVQVGNLTVSGNCLHDWYPTDGNHPDAMQFATMNSTKSSHDVTITDNLIYRGAGQNSQGIFAGDELGNMPFVNFTITNNLIIGTGSSALRPTHCQGLTLIGNELLTIAGGDPTALLVQDSDRVSASGNSAVSFSVKAADGNTNLTLGSNPTTQPVTQAVADMRVAAWLAAHPVGPSVAVPPAPAPPPPPPVDPSAKYVSALNQVVKLGTAANAKRAGPTKADMAGVLAVVKAVLT